MERFRVSLHVCVCPFMYVKVMAVDFALEVAVRIESVGSVTRLGEIVLWRRSFGGCYS